MPSSKALRRLRALRPRRQLKWLLGEHVRWLSVSGITLSVIGILASIDLTVAHYTTPTILACPDTGVINCAKVTTSIYSQILGIPLPLLGLGFFIVMLALQLPKVWRSHNRTLRLGRLIFAGTGLIMVFWLVYAELFLVNAICLYCTAVHIMTILLFLQTAIGTALTWEDYQAAGISET
jgi:uncharacterized membrane protein